jgi:hypothetical protein
LTVFVCLFIGAFMFSETIRNIAAAIARGIASSMAVLFLFIVVIPGMIVFSLAAIIPDVTMRTVSFLLAVILGLMLFYLGRSTGGTGGGEGFGGGDE